MNFLQSVCLLKCPRCRQGQLFAQKNNLKWKNALKMNTTCHICHLHFELENGFWWGTGYVNYALSAIFSGITCLAWFLTFGFNTQDNSVLWWLFFNAILVIILQPFIMRLGRSLYIHLFVFYDPHIAK